MLSELEEILADTGPFIRFAQRDLHQQLAGHMGSVVRITQDVSVELHIQASDENPKLKTFDWLNPKFPQGEPIRALGQTAKNIDRIQKRRAEKEAKDSGSGKVSDYRNKGEIATALVAADRGSAVLIDDNYGRDLAHARKLHVAGTDDLAAEMVAVGLLTVAQGRALARSARGTSSAQFRQKVLTVCGEIGATPPAGL